MNARFATKALPFPVTESMLEGYFGNGGVITVCPTGRRNQSNRSFPAIKGSLSYTGAKSATLKQAGLKGRSGS